MKYICLLVLLVLIVTPAVADYGLLGFRWPTDQGNGPPHVVNSGLELVDNVDPEHKWMVNAAEEMAINDWRNQMPGANLSFTIIDRGTTQFLPVDDGETTICWRDNDICSLGTASTYREQLAPWRISGFDIQYYVGNGYGCGAYCWHICMNPHPNCSNAGYDYDVQSIALHEMGHSIVGLNHFNVCYPGVMYGQATQNCDIRDLNQDDNQIANWTFSGLAQDVDEPWNDRLATANFLGQIDPRSPTYNYVFEGGNRLPGYCDVDVFEVELINTGGSDQISFMVDPGDPNWHYAIEVYYQGYTHGIAVAQTAGGTVSDFAWAAPGLWQVRVYSSEWKSDGYPYTLYIEAHGVVANVGTPPVPEPTTLVNNIQLFSFGRTVHVSGLTAPGRLEMFNISGQEVTSWDVQGDEWSGQISSNRTTSPRGIYFLRLSQGGQVVAKKKMVVIS